MGCQVHSLNPQFVYNGRPNQLSKNFSFQPNLRIRTALFSNDQQQQYVSTATVKQAEIPKPDACNVSFRSLASCKLGISRYPDFEYNAEGGTGSGTARKAAPGADSDGEVSVEFDVKELYIPPVSSATTKFLGLPLPPFLRIEVIPVAFQGKINQESGKVELNLRANFCFSVGSIYRAPALVVDTVLTTEESRGEMRGGKGERLNEDRMCRLVGVAIVEPIDDVFMNTFLSLPTECLAVLNAFISFSDSAQQIV